MAPKRTSPEQNSKAVLWYVYLHTLLYRPILLLKIHSTDEAGSWSKFRSWLMYTWDMTKSNFRYKNKALFATEILVLEKENMLDGEYSWNSLKIFLENWWNEF